MDVNWFNEPLQTNLIHGRIFYSHIRRFRWFIRHNPQHTLACMHVLYEGEQKKGITHQIMHAKYIWVHRIFSSSFWVSVSGTLSIQLRSSGQFLTQTGRWNISMITIIRVLGCNNEIGPWVKTLSVINIAPLLKMIVLISATSSCFTHWAWTNLQVASIEDPVWILKTFCTYF